MNFRNGHIHLFCRKKKYIESHRICYEGCVPEEKYWQGRKDACFPVSQGAFLKMAAFLSALEAYVRLKYFDTEKEKKHLQSRL